MKNIVLKTKVQYGVLLLMLLLSSCSSENPKQIESPREQIINVNQYKDQFPPGGEGFFNKKLTSYADTTHSSIEFRTKHSGVYDVIGWIQSFNIKMIGQKKDFTDISVEASADIRSVKMPNPGMAENLQGLFDTKNHPQAHFKSTGISEIGINQFKLIGDLTIKSITKKIELGVTFNGFGVPLTSGMPGFTVNGEFNRFDFNIGEPGDIYSGSPNPLIGDSIYFRGNLRMFYSAN